MIAKNILCAAVVALSVGYANGAVSNSQFVYVDTDEMLSWRTVEGGAEVDISIPFPEGASEATLAVVGASGYSKTYENITTTSCTVVFPAVVSSADEEVYTLTLSFDKGEALVQTVACISGFDGSATAVGCCRTPEGSSTWRRMQRYSVVPVLAGADQSITVDGETLDVGFDGSATWVKLGEFAPGAVTALTLSLAGEESAANLVCRPTSKLVISVR